jgi:hypothetical protein
LDSSITARYNLSASHLACHFGSNACGLKDLSLEVVVPTLRSAPLGLVGFLLPGVDLSAFATGFVTFFFTAATFLLEEDVFAFGAVFFFLIVILTSFDSVSGIKRHVSRGRFFAREEAWKKRTLLPKNEIDSNVHANLLSDLSPLPLGEG